MRSTLVEDWVDRRSMQLMGISSCDDPGLLLPKGEAGLFCEQSVHWQVFRNPLSLLIGGIASVVLQLGDPSVRAGVQAHSGFAGDPLGRLRRTARAAMVLTYGSRSQAEATVRRINSMHAAVTGIAPDGRFYDALDPQVLSWVHATASFGFLNARHRYVTPLDDTTQDRFYREALRTAVLFGATHAPQSSAEMSAVLVRRGPSLEPSPVIIEFLRTMEGMTTLCPPIPFERWLVRAALRLIPPALRDRLELGEHRGVRAWEAAVIRAVARRVDAMDLKHGASSQARRRLAVVSV